MKKIYFSIIFIICNIFNLSAQNNALQFDGTDDFITVSGNIPGGDHFTFMTWFNPSASGNNKIISSSTFEVSLSSGGIQVYTPSGNGEYGYGAYTLNSWNSLAVVYDNPNMYIYINDVLVGTFTAGTIGTINPYIGRHLVVSYLNYAGLLDEMSFWNISLSQSDIIANKYKSIPSTTTGLTAYYPFNQGIASGSNPSVTTLNDISVNTINGVLNNFALSGGASNWVASATTVSGSFAFSNALQFSSAGANYVGLNNFITEFNNPFTVEMWARVPAGNTLSSLLFKDNGNGSWERGEKNLYIDGSGQPAFVGNWNGYIYTNQAVNDGNWHHIAVTYNGAGSGKIYIDGIDRSNGGGYTSFSVDNYSGASTIYLGKPNNAESSAYFNGDMDEVRIWNLEVSAVNILANKNKKTLGTESGLVAYYDFDQGIPGGTNTAISSLIDKTANAYNGTLVNFTKTGSTSNFIGSVVTTNGIYAIITSITGITSSQTVCSGLTIPLAVTVTGTSLTYQWYKNGTSITGATASSLTLTGVTSTSAGVYSVAINGAGGNITSAGISLGVGCNNALAFNGSPSNVSIPYTTDLQVGTSTDFTLEAWIKYTGNATDYTGIIARANAAVPFYQLCLVGNRIAAELNSGSMFGVGQGLQGSTTLNDGIWHHVAMVVSRASQNVKLYVDGNVQVNVNNASVAGDLNASIGYLVGSDRVPGAFLTGSIDEVRIWHVALSQQEIQNNRFKSVNATVSGLIANYDFNQGIAGGNNTGLNTLTDRSGNNRTGTLNSFSLSGSLSNWVTATATTTTTGPFIFSTTITGITASQTVCSGVTIPLSVTATGTSVTYQWYKNGTSIAGATASILTLTGITSTSAGVYSVAISGTGGNITSSGIALGVGCNNALNFDGSDDYVFINQTSSVRNLGISGFTLSAWVFPTNATGVYSIIRKSGDYNLYINNGKIGAEVWPGGEGTSPFFIQTGSTSIPSNQWTNVAAVWNGTSFVLYVNGILDPSSLNSSSVATNDNLTIGRSISFSQDFLGSLDEIYIWNIPLSPVDIQSNYNRKPATTVAGLVAYFDFNEGIANGSNASITTLIDKSGYSNSGALNNFALFGSTSNWTGSVVTSSGTFAFTVPTITGITTSQIVFNGANVPLAVTATGTSLTYQWQFNGANIPGATASTFTITGINTTSAGIYSIAISNLGGNITSSGISIALVNTLDNTGLTTLTSQVAYATRKLSSSYNGYAIRVRRTDNAEADVAFDGSGYVSAFSVVTITAIGGSGFSIGNTMSFSTFYAATNCFVTTWYDQSGYGRNSTQGTGTSQPSIVSAGSLNTFSNKPSISFNGSNEMSIPLNSLVINTQGAFSIVEYQSALQNNFNAILAWSNGSSASPGFGPLNGAGVFGLYGTFNPANVNLGPIAANTSYVLNASWTSNGTSVIESRNGTTVTGSLGSIFSQSIATGFMGRDATSFYNGKVSEIIIFSTPLFTVDRLALETNQINLYVPPTITGITSSQTVCSGVTTSLSVTSTGTSLTYQWYKNGTSITGATTSILTLTGITSTSAGVYSVAISGTGGNITSSGISLGVGCNNALDFSGTSNIVTSTSYLSYSDNISIELWAKVNSTPTSNAFLFHNGNTSSNGYGLFMQSGSTQVNLLLASVIVLPTGYSLPLNTWTHLAIIRNNGTWSLLINGSVTGFISTQISIPVSGNVSIGSSTNNGGEPFTGDIEEFRFWNKVLNQANIQANMNRKPIGNESGLVTYYDFDQGLPGGNNASLTTLYDKTSATNNATLTNFGLSAATSNWISSGVSITGTYAFIAPSITGITSSQTVCSGFALPLSVTVTGSGLTYQWLKNGSVIPGATASTLTLTGVTSTVAGVYSVAISSLGGNITSSGISLGVGCNNALSFDGSNDAITFGSLPISGNNARTVEGWVKTSFSGSYQNPFSSGTPSFAQSFNIKITDTGRLGIMGFNNDYYPTTGAILNDGNWHHFAVSYDGSIARGYVDGNLDWSAPLSFVTSGNANYIGQSNDLGFTQYFNGVMDELRIWNIALSQSDIQANRFRTVNNTVPGLLAAFDFNEGVAGGNNAAVTTLLDRSGNNLNGSLSSFTLNGATSNWVSATNSITGFITLAAPTITGISPSVTVCSGVTTSLAITVTGGSGAMYQWMKNGAAISGATASSLLLTGVTATTAGVYSVAVQSAGGNITSSGISLGVIALPSITGFESSPVGCVGLGSTISISTLVINTVQWYLNSASIPGANNLTLSVSGASVSSGSYFAQVFNSCGSVSSTTVGVSIADYVSISGISPDFNACPGTSLVITISGSGGGTQPVFQWYKDGAAIPGANAVFYTVSGISAASTGNYFMTASALCGSGTSPGFNLAVNCNNALDLDGTNDFVEVTVPGVLNTNVFTVECWAYCTGGSSYKSVLSKRDAGGWIIYFDAANSIALWNGYSPLITGPVASLNTWNHIAITSDNSGQSLYINGSLAGSSTQIITPSANNLRIGTDDGNQWNFGGKIDEVRLWNRVLTATELQSNLNCQLTGSELGLIAYYDFNQNAAGGNNTGKNILTDRTTNGNNGNLFNFSLTGASSNWLTGSASVSGTCVPLTYAVYTIGGNGNFISNGSTGISTTTGTDFDMALQGSSVSRSFSINNTGIPDVVITAASITGANAEDFSFSASPLGTITGGSSANFTVDYNPASFCTGVATVKIFTNSLISPVYQFNVRGTRTLETYVASVAVNSFCGTGVTNVSLTGSELGVTYSLKDVFTNTTLQTLAGTGSAMTFSNVTLTSGGYDLRVYGDNTGAGCQQVQMTGSLLTNVIFLPLVTATVTSPVVCLGQTVTFNGSGAVSYAWSDGVNDGNAFIPSATHTYTVTGTDNFGCSKNAFTTVTVNSLPNVGINNSSSIVCTGNPVTLAGTGAVSYVWTGGVTNGIGFTPGSTNTYTVTGTDAKSCQNTAIAVVSVVSSLVVTGIVNPSPNVCIGNIVTLSGIGAVSYTWSGGVTDGVGFTPSVSGVYSVLGFVSAGCQSMSTVSITVNALPSITGSVSPAQICEGGSATFTGSGALSYSWSGGVIDGAATYPTVTGFYTVTGTDANGCSNTNQKNIIVNSAPPIQILGNNQACPGIGASLSATGGDTYLWSVGSTTSAIIYPIAVTTVFSVTGTNTLTGCSLTVSKSINVVSTYGVNSIPSAVNYGTVQSIQVSSIAGQAYTLTAGSLPTGLSLNGGTGFISGSVSILGAYGFSINITNGGCTSTVGFSINVTKAPLSIKVVDTVIYQNQNIPAQLRVTVTGLAAWDNLNITRYGTTTATSAVIGNYPVNVFASGAALSNYNVTTIAGNLEIHSITGIMITGRIMSKQYGLPIPTLYGIYSVDGIVMPMVSLAGINVVTINGIVETITSTFSTNALTTSGVGSINFINASAASITNAYRYNFFTNSGGQLLIDPLKLRIKADDKIWLEGQPMPTLTGTVISQLNSITGIVPGDDVVITYDYEDGTVLTTTGPFIVIPEAKGGSLTNYSFIMFSGTVRKLSGLTVTSGNFSKKYGASVPTAAIAAGYTVVGLKGTSPGLNVENKIVPTLGIDSPVGLYNVIPNVTGYDQNIYYLTTVGGMLTVNPAGLTVLAVNFSKVQGDANPTLTGQIIGLQSYDIPNFNVNYSTDADTDSPVGDYPITSTVSGSATSNYVITQIPGILKIGAAPSNLSVSANSFSKVYGSDNPVFTGNMTGLVAGDDVSSQYITDATANSPVGTYSINIALSGADVGKYVVTTTPGILTITKAPLTVKAETSSRKYGIPNKTFNGVITGLMPGDNISVIYETSPLTNANSTAGKYPIIPNVTGTVLSNYDLTTIADTLVINKVGLIVLGATLNRIYGIPNPALTYNIDGFVHGDNISVIDAVPVGTTTATETSPVGTYPITYANAADSNYVFTYTEGTLKITKALQTITVSSVNAKVKTGESITLSAASSSGLPLSVAIADGTVLSVNGLAITGLIDGISKITITQPGDGNYEPADPVFVDVVSTSTGVLSVFSFVMAGTDTAYAGISELSFTFASKIGVTYQWSYTGTDISRDNQTTANIYKIAFSSNATNGYVIGKVLDENGNILKQDSIYVTVVKFSEADLASNPVLADKIIAATMVKQLAKVDCEPVATDCENAYILSFNLGVKLANKTTCSKGGYGNFTSIGKIDSLIMGNAYRLRVSAKNSLSSTNYFAIWIDYGNDGSFEDPDDFINSSFSPDSVFEIKNVVIRNNDSYIGPRRVRIGMRTSGTFVKSESCPAEGTVGETEDYLIYVRKQDALEAPKLLTPNNDGKNDLFIVKGINPKLNNKLTILDRWGVVKYEKENYENDWDGKDQSGITMVDGTYFYFFTNGDNLIKGYVEIKTK